MSDFSDLNVWQRDGLACVRCGADLTAPGVVSRPAGVGPSGQVFECGDHGEVPRQPEHGHVIAGETGTLTISESGLGSELISLMLDDGTGAGRVVVLDVEAAHSLIDALNVQIRRARGVE